jgi:hypothetical protein
MRDLIQTKEQLNTFIATLASTLTLGSFTQVIDGYITDELTKQKLTSAIGKKSDKNIKMTVAKGLASQILKFKDEHMMFDHYSDVVLYNLWACTYANRHSSGDVLSVYVEGDRSLSSIEGIVATGIDFEPDRMEERFTTDSVIQSDLPDTSLPEDADILRKTEAIGAAVTLETKEKWHQGDSTPNTKDLTARLKSWFDEEFDSESPNGYYSFSGSASYHRYDLAKISEEELFKLMMIEIDGDDYTHEILSDGFERLGSFTNEFNETFHWNMDEATIVVVNEDNKVDKMFAFSSDIKNIYKNL